MSIEYLALIFLHVEMAALLMVFVGNTMFASFASVPNRPLLLLKFLTALLKIQFVWE